MISVLLLLSVVAPVYGADAGKVSAFAIPTETGNTLELKYDVRSTVKDGVTCVPTASDVKMFGKGAFGTEGSVQYQWAPVSYTVFNRHNLYGQEVAYGYPDGLGASDADNTLSYTVRSPGEYSVKCDFVLYSSAGGAAWREARDDAGNLITGFKYQNFTAIPFYYVIYDSNGGTPTPAPVFIPEGNILGALPASPTRVGYVFDGWYTAAVGGELVTANTVVTSMILCYAHWTASCTVIFDVQGGNPISPVAAQPGQAIGSLPNPVRAGYTFQGWYTAPLGGSKVSVGTVVLANVTFYARWAAKDCKVTFNANKGKISKKAKYTVTKPSGDKLGKLKTPVRKGYKFKGWYTKKSGGQKISKNTKVPASNVVYYAQWKKK
jgi:uncharacterized repeat protein (TIGR02543 family)